MVEELKTEARNLTNLIGFKGKIDVTSRAFTLEMIRALEEKYKEDLESTVRLRRLEFYHDLIENSRLKQRERVGAEENFVLSDRKEKRDQKKKKKEHQDEEEDHEKVEVQEEKEDEGIRLEDEGKVKTAEEIDEWKNLMTLAKINYLMEYPNSEGLAWKRRTKKRKTIKKFTDKDLIEWNASQHIRLKALEKWALSRDHARKLSEESPYELDDFSDDDESRELEDMFHVMELQKPKKRTLSELEKALISRRPFKLTDETMEDWTESYSDDSEEPGAEKMFDGLKSFYEEPDVKVEEFASVPEEEPEDESDMLEVFSNYKEILKYRNPAFKRMDDAQNMGKWYDLCDNTMGKVKPPSEALRKVGFLGGEKEPRVKFSVIEEEEELSEKNGIYFSNQPKEQLAQEPEEQLVGASFQENVVFHDALDEQGDEEEEVPIFRRYLVCGNWQADSDEQYSFLMDMGCICPFEEPLDPNTEIAVAFPSTNIARCVMPSYWFAVQIYLNDSQEISTNMVEDAGAGCVIIGQGERDIELEENNVLIAEKVGQALYGGLQVIVCIGELPEERESGKTLEVLFRQIKAISNVTSDWTNIVLAYEPVFEIGTGQTHSPDQVQYIHAELRNWLRDNVSDYAANTTRIIYAGSVTSDNCKEFADQEDIDGFLVVSTHIQTNEFKFIVNINLTG